MNLDRQLIYNIKLKHGDLFCMQENLLTIPLVFLCEDAEGFLCAISTKYLCKDTRYVLKIEHNRFAKVLLRYEDAHEYEI